MHVSIILILCMDNSSIFCSFTRKYFLCAVVKKHAFWRKLLFHQLSNMYLFISNNFPQSDDEMYNLYKSVHFPIRFNPFVRKVIYLIVDISGTPLTEEQIVNFKRTYC